ncbi:MAG: amidohydrolase family protein [Gammaproteobacteria bacterium]|nr:amidohydrolase family protein [Gammaproteobacteria bacterium]
MRTPRIILLASIIASGCGTDVSEQTVPEPADLILHNGYVYTVDARRSIAEAVAVRDGEIVGVGDNAAVAGLRGEHTRMLDLEGRMVIPGLHDVHIHLLGIVDRDSCDLENATLSLAEMVPLLKECIRRYQLEPGAWLVVDQWNPFIGNDTSARYPTIRSALDDVSREHPIILQGNDGHHAAVNGLALEGAVDGQGVRVGLSGETLKTQFADYREFVGLDSHGEPNGALNEDARNLVEPPAWLSAGLAREIGAQIGPILASHGITSAQDAMMLPAALETFLELERSGDLGFRLHAAMYLDPSDYRTGGVVDIDGMVAELDVYRTRYRDSALISPNAAKIFVDGVIEGNPLVNPPTLPAGAALEPYLQPRFDFEAEIGKLRLIGYVDTGSALCESVRAGDIAHTDAAVMTFQATHGFHPGQCIISRGVLEDDETFVLEYTRALDSAGFTVHSHAIGDRAVRVAVDAFEAARRENGDTRLPHAIAHAQLVHPIDQQRIGELGLYMAFTYAWMDADFSYDMMVVPFFAELEDETHLYDLDSYYMQNVYPVRSLKEAGAVLVAGSDAPVEDRSPRPFVNMATELTRTAQGVALNAGETVNVHDLLAAYTINGARALRQADRVGSIEVGKRADLAVLDRNVVELAEAQRWLEFAGASVIFTLFDGQVVYETPEMSATP